MGWFGRETAREWRDPDMERAWPLPAAELDRFIAEGGWGMLELMPMCPRV